MTYTVWCCCGLFDPVDTKEEAIGCAVAWINGAAHQVLAVEGPGGEDLMDEAQEAAVVTFDECRKESQEARKKVFGQVEVKGPTGKWWGRYFVYSVEGRDKELAEMRGLYGEDRVRFVEKPESKPYKGMGAVGELGGRPPGVAH